MLVLVSFGLVLLATILLVVGLLSDGGLSMIYLSILSSVVAGVVLVIAWRRARPTADDASEAPAPLPMPDPDPTTVAASPSPAPAAERPSPAPAPEPAPAPAAAPAAASDEDVDFPIADYDELTVAEIMPLLPQLYSDELDTVIEREQAGKNRQTIVNRLEQLKETGTEADAAEADEAPAPAPAPAAPVSFSDDDDDFFPIADYDELTVAQIVPLLPKLELDELEDVRDREQAGAARAELLNEIDRFLSGELEVVGYRPEDDVPVEPAPAKAATKKKATRKKAASKKRATKKKATKKKAASKKKATRKKAAGKKKATRKKAAAKKAAPSNTLPIADYDSLTVARIRPQLADLSAAQLRAVRDHEAAGAARKTILTDIDNRLS